jgi:fructan beta-fructosidase
LNSFTSIEPYRPTLHFSPREHWINDPNGLICVDGVYHMFFQYYPDGLVHGPMHWGHASSRDLAHWTEHDIALYPDELGQCFSGSAVAAAEGNVAPELNVAPGDILLFYTAHLPREGQDGLQTQCLAIGNHELTSFRRIAHNPIVANPGIRAFRDPKVIWHEATNAWVMVITHGQSIGFYTSPDALHWTFASEFGADEGRHGDGPWECPDLFSIMDSNGERHWILVVGIGEGHVTGGSGTQYFVGGFDGSRFVNHHDAATELWMDWGRDFYAAQSFAGLAGEPPLALAWASNWNYARQTRTQAFRGVMSLPRRLALVATGEGPQLRQWVDETAASAFGRHRVTASSDNVRLSPASGTYRLAIEWSPTSGSRLSICLFGEDRPQFVVSASASGASLRVVRAPSGIEASRNSFESEFDVPLDLATVGTIDLFVDNGVVECGFCDGAVWVTMLYFPDDPAGAVSVSASE